MLVSLAHKKPGVVRTNQHHYYHRTLKSEAPPHCLTLCRNPRAFPQRAERMAPDLAVQFTHKHPSPGPGSPQATLWVQTEKPFREAKCASSGQKRRSSVYQISRCDIRQKPPHRTAAPQCTLEMNSPRARTGSNR